MRLALASAACSLLIVNAGWAADQPAPRLVSTTGSAEIRVIPDVADLYFEIEVRGQNLNEPLSQHAERSAKVIATLRSAGIRETELQASQTQISPNYGDEIAEPFSGPERRAGEPGKLRYFRMTQAVSCTLHDLKKLPEVTANVVRAGATGVREASLRTSKLRKYRDEARAQAVRAAKEKATALAAELGVKIGRPYTITENGSYGYYGGANMQRQVSIEGNNGSTESGLPTFAPGMISVNATVSVSFLLE